MGLDITLTLNLVGKGVGGAMRNSSQSLTIIDVADLPGIQVGVQAVEHPTGEWSINIRATRDTMTLLAVVLPQLMLTKAMAVSVLDEDEGPFMPMVFPDQDVQATWDLLRSIHSSVLEWAADKLSGSEYMRFVHAALPAGLMFEGTFTFAGDLGGTTKAALQRLPHQKSLSVYAVRTILQEILRQIEGAVSYVGAETDG